MDSRGSWIESAPDRGCQKLAALRKSGDACQVNSVNGTSRCVVCGHTDVRALATVRLSGGANVIVCGTHELMHRRLRQSMRTVDEMRRAMSERRRASGLGERRDGMPCDELGAQLTAAFAGERRAGSERRRS